MKIFLRKFLWLKKLKILVHEHMVSVMLSMKKSLERFAKKNCKKINQREFGVEKLIKGKGDTSYGNW